jgi:Uma2 family endonuclease
VSANPSSWSVTFREYLRFEREAEERHELIDGEIVAMAGAPIRHNLLCERLRDFIRPVLGEGPCVLHGSDQRLAIDVANKGAVAYYPDLAVYCSEAVHALDEDSRTEPALLIEVTSKSTEKKDRGVKLEDYRQIPTLEEYLIVSHERQELELWTRAAERWTRTLVTSGELALRSGARLDVERLYRDLP